GFKVQQNYPNPFNPTTQIGYELPTNEKITIVVYNTSGQSIRKLISQNQHAGYHHVIWDARNDAGEKVSSGIYYYLVKAGNYAAI
ncbi:MAG: T9SS type A sorting domain-containing protein, partial [Aliifodinibius sp.]|nr:T9SS type A sorting domain-containing protein [Fodinibius sp.]